MTARRSDQAASSERRHGSRGRHDGLDEAFVEAVAQRTAAIVLEALGHRPAVSGLVDAAVVAAELGVKRAWVYAHAERLGGRRLGDGPRARWRFDVEEARALHASFTSKRSVASDPPAGSGDVGDGVGGGLPERAAPLPVQGPSAASAAVAVLTPRPGARRGGRRAA